MTPLLVLLDLSSAFDTVDHSTLLSILQARFSVTGQSLGWFRRSYLTDRAQIFTTQCSQTPPIPLTSGVPPCLGPMLFATYTEGTIYTSVFDAHVAQYHLFADDAQPHECHDHCPVSAASSLVTRLLSCVTDLANSYASLRLQLHPPKTEFIWFGTRHSLAKLPTECRSLTVCSTLARSPVPVSII